MPESNTIEKPRLSMVPSPSDGMRTQLQQAGADGTPVEWLMRLSEAARAIYDACFTLAPIPFEEAQRRQTLHYRRAMAAAAQARERLVPN
jgi:hypothetical protein